MISSFESLPAEIFHNILSHLLGAVEAKRAPTSSTVRGYHFHTAIRRVNKDIHRLAKSYLDNVNDWVRFDIGLPVLNPASLDAPIFVIPSGGSPPNPLLKVQLRFRDVLLRLKAYKHVVTTDTVCYVLEQDLPSFLRYVRVFDYLTCQRVQPGEALSGRQELARKCGGGRMSGVHGVSYNIQITKDAPIGRYRPVLELFRDLHGPLHDCAIVGHEDPAHAREIEYSIRNEPGGHATNPDERERTLLLLRLKVLGDQQFLEGRYEAAHGTYRAAQVLVPEQGMLSRYDVRTELHPTSPQAVFCRSMKDALCRAVCLNDILAMTKCGGSKVMVAKNVDVYNLGRCARYPPYSARADHLQHGVFFLVLAYYSLLVDPGPGAFARLRLAEQFLGLLQVCPQHLQLSRIRQTVAEWDTMSATEQRWAIAHNASVWMRELNLPLAYWTVHESLVPEEIRSDFMSILPSNFVAGDTTMAGDIWADEILKLGGGYGMMYHC